MPEDRRIFEVLAAKLAREVYLQGLPDLRAFGLALRISTSENEARELAWNVEATKIR
jgi:hypothetical protein